MSVGAYYNEYDPFAAEWLRNLIKKGHLPNGEVDTRSIVDVRADDLRGFTQCHFFAGIGGWSYALRLAGWPDDRPVWTGSCPCQPFSAAGKRSGTDDERHLWPHQFRLLAECRPDVWFGEQVASKDGLHWLDLVLADLEGAGYAAGAVDLCAAGLGAPHIRQRLWIVGERVDDADGRDASAEGLQRSGEQRQKPEDGHTSGLANTEHDQQRQGRGSRGEDPQGHEPRLEPGRRGAAGRVADAGYDEPSGRNDTEDTRTGPKGRYDARREFASRGPDDRRPGPVNGQWRAADWLHCRDGKWRPVEASPQPLADGLSEILGRVRPEVCQEIQEAVDATALENQVSRASLLRALWQSLGAQARQVWEAGRLPRLHEAPFLLAFLRQLQEQGWCVEESSPLPREEEQARLLRMLRDDNTIAGSPHRRELEEQLTVEPANALHFLSSLLARHAQAAWGHAYETYAEIGFPLGHGSPARVGRLRGYGNAIVPQVAAEVIAAWMECLP